LYPANGSLPEDFRYVRPLHQSILEDPDLRHNPSFAGASLVSIHHPGSRRDSRKNKEGDTLRFGIPLNRDAQVLAGLVHEFTRRITGLCAQEIQAQKA